MNQKYLNAISLEKSKEKKGDRREADWGVWRKERAEYMETAPKKKKKEEKVFPEMWFQLSWILI